VREHKPEIVRIVASSETMWPPESQSHARLFPFICKRVWTPNGPGLLLSAYAELCEILPEGATKTVRVRTEDVVPLPIQ
jgi:hypothetical protein